MMRIKRSVFVELNSRGRNKIFSHTLLEHRPLSIQNQWPMADNNCSVSSKRDSSRMRVIPPTHPKAGWLIQVSNRERLVMTKQIVLVVHLPICCIIILLR